MPAAGVMRASSLTMGSCTCEASVAERPRQTIGKRQTSSSPRPRWRWFHASSGPVAVGHVGRSPAGLGNPCLPQDVFPCMLIP